MRNKKKQMTPSSHPSASETKLCPWITHFLHMNGAGRRRMGVVFSWQCITTATDSFSCSFPVPVGGPTHMTLLNWLLQGVLFPRTAASQEQTALAWAPCRFNKSCQISWSCMSSSSWATAPTRSLLLHGLYGLQHCGALHWLQGSSLPHHNLCHTVQENVYANSYSASSLFFFIYHGVCRAVSLPYSHSFLKCCCADFF